MISTDIIGLCSICFFFYCVSFIYCLFSFFFFNDTATTEIYTLSLHDALPISRRRPATDSSRRCSRAFPRGRCASGCGTAAPPRSEEHTSELQSRFDLVCRLLLEKKKNTK